MRLPWECPPDRTPTRTRPFPTLSVCRYRGLRNGDTPTNGTSRNGLLHLRRGKLGGLPANSVYSAASPSPVIEPAYELSRTALGSAWQAFLASRIGGGRAACVPALSVRAGSNLQTIKLKVIIQKPIQMRHGQLSCRPELMAQRRATTAMRQIRWHRACLRCTACTACAFDVACESNLNV